MRRIILPILLVMLLGACPGDGDRATIETADPVEAAVESGEEESGEETGGESGYAVVRSGGNSSEHRAIGSFEADEEITVSAEVGGTLLSMPVDVGDVVRPGTLICRIDPENFRLRLESARALLAVAEAGLGNARSEYERKQILFDEGAIPQSTLELFRTQLEMAEAQVRSAEAAVALAEKALGDTRVEASVAGVVSARPASAGEFIGSGDPLVVISVVDPIVLRFSVPERLAAEVAVGDEVDARLAAYPGRLFGGEVTLVSPTVDRQTRTVPIEAEFDNGDGALRPGFFAESIVRLSGGQATFLVPGGALFSTNGGLHLRVLGAEGVREVAVALVEQRGNSSLVTGPLEGGERVELQY